MKELLMWTPVFCAPKKSDHKPSVTTDRMICSSSNYFTLKAELRANENLAHILYAVLLLLPHLKSPTLLLRSFFRNI